MAQKIYKLTRDHGAMNGTDMNNCFILNAGDEIIAIVKSQFHATEMMSALAYDNKVTDEDSFTLTPTYHPAFDDKKQE